MRQKISVLVIIIVSLVIGLFGLRQPKALTASIESFKGDLYNPKALGFLFSDTSMTSKIQTTTPSVFGPQICVDYGDAFSPWNSPFEPNSYTHQYRIAIPADYDHDIVRVEIFDPDSINSAENEATVARTSLVQNPTVVNPVLGSVTTKFCGIDTIHQNARQDFPCVLPTDELSYLDDPLTLEQINPFWLMRVDENRGGGSGNGNGTCSVPDSYNPAYNTATLFELFYYTEDGDGEIARSSLASYTGQTGDNARDTGNHNTDLYWISPGATNQGPDFDAFYGISYVPVDPGSSIDSFEIDLTEDVPNIETDENGIRYLNIDVTAISGASENVFAFWAGPPSYTSTVPANANHRNVVVTNDPGAHYSGGVTVTAVDKGVASSIINFEADYPLFELDENWEGETISLTFFDVDSGSEPEVTFYMDSIPEQDWSWTYGFAGQDDSDGLAEGIRCKFGECDGLWVNPSLQIKLPGDYENCDPTMVDSPSCVSFYRGRLMMRATFGEMDTFSYDVSGSKSEEKPIDDSCATYPIAIGLSARSVSEPGSGSNPFPMTFDYPLNPPSYHQFGNHQPNVILDYKTPEGTLYKYNLGSDVYNFRWLVWNQFILPTDQTLGNSLQFPGDSTDYSDHGDVGGSVHPEFGYVIRGYSKPGDSTDRVINTFFDSIPVSFSQLSSDIESGTVNIPINEHIDLGRIITLPIVFEEVAEYPDQVFVERFGYFRLLGYGDAGTQNEWLLVEYMGINKTCGQYVEPEPPIVEDGEKVYLPLIIRE